LSGPGQALAGRVSRWYVDAAVFALVMMVLAIQYGSDWLLNFLHVMTGALWTGIDLFMGFVVGPVLKRLPLEGRRAVISGLVPRTLFLNGDGQHHLLDHRLVPRQTNGFSRCRLPGVPLGHRGPRHRNDPDYPGTGILLPTNLRLYFELQKPNPDSAKIGRWMRWFVAVVAIQGTMQVAIFVVMAKFATGL
jgi:hypothetical protein